MNIKFSLKLFFLLMKNLFFSFSSETYFEITGSKKDACKKTYVFGNDEVRNSRVTKSSYETELHKMTSHFELIPQKILWKFSFRVTKSSS